jgi:hypothetical protein
MEKGIDSSQVGFIYLPVGKNQYGPTKTIHMKTHIYPIAYSKKRGSFRPDGRRLYKEDELPTFSR